MNPNVHANLSYSTIHHVDTDGPFTYPLYNTQHHYLKAPSFHGPSDVFHGLGGSYFIERTVDILPCGDQTLRAACDHNLVRYDVWVDNVRIHNDIRGWVPAVMTAFEYYTWPGAYPVSYWIDGDQICGGCAMNHWVEEGVALQGEIDYDEAGAGHSCANCDFEITEAKCIECRDELSGLVGEPRAWPAFRDDEGQYVMCAKCMAESVAKKRFEKVGLLTYKPIEAKQAMWYTSPRQTWKADPDIYTYYKNLVDEEVDEAKFHVVSIDVNDDWIESAECGREYREVAKGMFDNERTYQVNIVVDGKWFEFAWRDTDGTIIVSPAPEEVEKS